jgi:hypothetical protein
MDHNQEELNRIIQQVNENADAHNNDPAILEQLNIRRNIVNNTDNYLSGNREHNVQMLQICSRQEWEMFHDLFGLALFANPSPYVRELLDDMDNGFGSIYGNLQIMLFRSFAGGISHYAFFTIIIDPHRHFIDGDIEPFLYTDGDQLDMNLRMLFDDNPHSIVNEITEYEILNLVREHNFARELIDFFQNNDVENVRIQPPPNRGIDLAELYFAALGDDNIIPYWLENNNINQNIQARG